MDYYTILGLNHKSTQNEIKIAFKKLARKYHPDKVQANPQARDSENFILVREKFMSISSAYETLVDPLKRAKYDFEQGYLTSSEDIDSLHKIDAEMAVDLMRLTFDIKRRTEFSRQGLIIDDAYYGSKVNESKRINVTRPLQCMVQGSRLIIPKGDPKYLLIGFYNPCSTEERILNVKYYFRGRLHEVTIQDTEKLLMPLRSHLLKRKPYAQQSKQQVKRLSQTTTKILAVSAFFVLSGICTLTLLKRKQ